MAFVVERWREGAYTLEGNRQSITAESPEELEQQRRLLPDAPDTHQHDLVEQTTFYFGVDTQRSVQYDISIHKKSLRFPSSKQEK